MRTKEQRQAYLKIYQLENADSLKEYRDSRKERTAMLYKIWAKNNKARLSEYNRKQYLKRKKNDIINRENEITNNN